MNILSLFDTAPEIFNNVEVKKNCSKKRNKKHTISDTQLSFLDVIFSLDAKDAFKDAYISECDEIIEDIKKPLSLLFEASAKLTDFKLTKKIKLSGSLKEKFERNLLAIKTLSKLKSFSKNAEEKEKKILVKYTGWGSLSSMVNSTELKNLLSVDEYNSIAESINTAYYTPLELIQFMYRVLDRFGFDGGHILDPSCGIGHFFGAMPDTFKENSKLVGIEKDLISGQIAQQLYQSADINICGFENKYLKDNSFDLIISNIPFGDLKIYDKHDKEINEFKPYIHDYFFIKAVKKLRKGGLLAFITSSGTLDKTDSTVRKYLSEQCSLLGAVRLPINAFNEANTEVMTDIIFLKKTNLHDENNKWINTNSSLGANFNEYFVNNPKFILGDIKTVSSAFGSKDIVYLNEDIESCLNKIINEFPEDIYIPLDNDLYRYDNDLLINLENTNLENKIKQYSYVKIKDKFYQRQNLFLLPINVKNPILLDIFIKLKECIKDLIDQQLQNCSDDNLKEGQQKLNSIYDDFVSSFGYISEKSNKKLLCEDPEYYLAASIEDERGDIYIKGPFFTERTIGAKQQISKANTLEDALTYSFMEKGMLDIKYISDLLGITVNDVILNLEEKNLIFYDVNLDEYIYKEEYLSGNVKSKLAACKNLLSDIPKLKRNIDALKSVQPEYIYDVFYQLGTTWIDDSIYSKFINELLESNAVNVQFNKVLGQFSVSREGYINPTLFRVTYGTERLNAIQCFRHALNMTNPVIYDEVEIGDTKKRIKNVQDTELARAKVNLLKSKFLEWIDKNIEVKNNLLDYYNNNYNNLVNRTFNGSFINPQINPQITLREHQKNAIARILLSKRNTLLAHCVGSGKTYTMQVAGMELKRLGFISKPLYVIPNSLVESGQFVTEFLRIYPYANILAATSRDFQKANRRKLINKIATGNWDAIVIGHSSFSLIPIDVDFQIEIINENLEELRSFMYELDPVENKFAIKQIQKSIQKFEVRLKKLTDNRIDDGLPTFDKLGVDYIFVDEAHRFKNLAIRTKLTGVSGVQTSDAKKAFDLFTKISWLRKNKSKKCVTFATATPISNSVCEAYTNMHYLIPEILEEYGLKDFDSWASVYGQIISQLEVDATGTGFKVKDRFAKFCNVPELITMFRETADVITKDMINIPLPKLRNGSITNVQIENNSLIKSYINSLVERAEMIENKLVSPEKDNMLLVTMDGRKVATDPRLVGLDVNSEEDAPKIKALCENVYKEFIDGMNDKLTQAIFLNLGTPNGKGFNLYNEIKYKLIDKGIPESQIKFIHEANTAEKRSNMLRDFREGDFRILIGSTDKMGEGTNMQNRLVALHEFDCEWKPALIEQKEGRILRQGNINKEVSIYRYVIKGTFDVYMWQMCQTKATYIDQIMSNKTNARNIEDLGETILSFAETKALACENPLIMEKFKIDKEIQQLQILEKAHKQEQLILYKKVEDNTKYIDESKKMLHCINADYLLFKKYENEDFSININNNIFSDKMQAGEYLISYLDQLKMFDAQKLLDRSIKIGEFKGFDLMFALKKDFDNGSLVKVLGLKGKEYYHVEFSIAPRGLILRIENKLLSLNNTLNNIEEQIRLKTEESLSANNQISLEFKDKNRLKELLLKQVNINSKLNINSSIDSNITIESDTNDLENVI